MRAPLKTKPVKLQPPSEPNSIGQRLRVEMKTRGVTSAELAKRADVKTSFIYDVISGKSANPSTIKLARVAETLGVDLAYLVGNGDYRSLSSGRLSAQNSNDQYITIPRIMVDVSAGGGSIVSIQQEGERYSFRKQWIKDHLGTSPADLRLLYVRGDSMEPTLCHNDIILIDMSKKIPSPPGIFVLYDGFGLVAKRLEYCGESPHMLMRVISDNAQYSTYERGADETFVIGRVVWFAREI
jgi:phage repressor protein C with HTH and peptisase S24 domain